MAPRGRSRRAARADPAPEPAEEAGQPAGEAPQAAQILSRLNREYHIADALRPVSSTRSSCGTSPLTLYSCQDLWSFGGRRRIRFASRGGECTITLQDVAYHLGLRTDGDPVGGCIRDFQQHYQQQPWDMVEQYLGARPVIPPNAPKESFAIKML
ncbi:hypothetical protein PIB30_043592 [Stylosanthes scabra]|uniref:Uncharacterized protein n=1 Tax=Stylosanthes scabra TaxID=79078 RepID=A0ABU6SFQ5_9FABA|nr:hypothetical protein [Stylosanthes scabra]